MTDPVIECWVYSPPLPSPPLNQPNTILIDCINDFYVLRGQRNVKNIIENKKVLDIGLGSNQRPSDAGDGLEILTRILHSTRTDVRWKIDYKYSM